MADDFLHNLLRKKVRPGSRTIKVGFRRDILKICEELRHDVYETVILEDLPSIPPMATLSLRGIKHLILKNVGLLCNGSIFGMDDLETLEISGTVGYLNSGCITHCRNLREVIISANIYSSDEYLAVTNCRQLESVKLTGFFPKNLIHLTDDYSTYFDHFRQEGFSKFPLENPSKKFFEKDEPERERLKQSLLETAKWANLMYGRDKYIDDAIGGGATEMWSHIVGVFGSWTRAHKLRRIGWEYNQERDYPTVKTLKRSGPYGKDEKPIDVRFFYAPAYDYAFEINRRKFHLWKLSGKGTDVDKMIRLCRWVHESIRHKGDAVPNVTMNLATLMAFTARMGNPGNCLIQSICLSEALLSIGVKAKYIKGNRRKDDRDCYHVFVAAWSRKFKKWIFLDPTYGAYVKDTNGNYLSPAEIRYNLINDIPMMVYEAADYNGNQEAAKNYLNNFLAQYLYHMTANTISQDCTEGPANHPQGKWITLSPIGKYDKLCLGERTHDEDLFWQAPG